MRKGALPPARRLAAFRSALSRPRTLVGIWCRPTDGPGSRRRRASAADEDPLVRGSSVFFRWADEEPPPWNVGVT